MSRPRILIVPTLTELEWTIKPLLEEWADVASYDAPGVGDEPEPEQMTVETVARRGIIELDRLGWERAVVVGDEVGGATAARIAAIAPERVAALAFGHACLSFEREGARAPLNAGVFDALAQLARLDHRTFARAVIQSTKGAYDEKLAERHMERVPGDAYAGYLEAVLDQADRVRLADVLTGLEVPILLAEHRDCAMWTREGFEDAVEALPEATAMSTTEKPSTSPEFAEALRDFCARLPG